MTETIAMITATTKPAITISTVAVGKLEGFAAIIVSGSSSSI
jgi:hypothetical protein